MNSLDYIWRVFGHKAAGNHGLPVPGGVINGICVADQVWTMKGNTLSVTGRVWHRLEPFSVQAWYQWNQNAADGNGNGDDSELKAVLERQNVAWIPTATSGDKSWVLFLRHQICSQILLNLCLLYQLLIYHLFAHRIRVKRMNLWCLGRQSQENGGCWHPSKTCCQGYVGLVFCQSSWKLELGFL